MKRSRWFAPYIIRDKEHRATMADKWDEKRSGLYFIREEKTGTIVYVGQSQTQLKKTIYRHFQEWTDKGRSNHKRISYPKDGYEIRFIHCTGAQAERLERYWIKKLKPKDNEQKYESWFDKLTAPSEDSLKALAQKANLAPFLKKDEYWEDWKEPAFVDDGEGTPF